MFDTIVTVVLIAFFVQSVRVDVGATINSIVLGVLIAFFVPSVVHRIDAGHVGVYFRGALLDEISSPGWHIKSPITVCEMVETRMQTDRVRNVPCGVKGGAMLNFPQVEVVNQLPKEHVHRTIEDHGTSYDQRIIYSKIHHEMNQFCSGKTLQQVYIDDFDKVDDHLKDVLQREANRLAPGLRIESVRVSKPHIPADVQENYNRMETSRIELLAIEAKRRVDMEKAEAARATALIEANSTASVQASRDAKELAMKRAEQERKAIDDAIANARRKSEAEAKRYETESNANATLYSVRLEAEGNLKLLTEPYLRRHQNEALLDNTKVYFGPSIPKMLGSITAAAGAATELP